jgi:hypothetical protein
MPAWQMGVCSLVLLALLWASFAQATAPQIYVSAVYTERSARHFSLFGSVVFDISDAHTLALLATDNPKPPASDTISSSNTILLLPPIANISSERGASNIMQTAAQHTARNPPPRHLRLLDMGAGSCCEYNHPTLKDQAPVCEPSALPALLPDQILLVDGRARTRMLVPMPYLEGRAFTCVFSFRPLDFYADMNLTLDFSFPERFRRETRGRRNVVCSADEVLNATLGPTRSFCTPVNCILKYMGARNYFNRTSRLCEEFVLCPEGQLLNWSSNSCIVLTVQVAPNFTLPLDLLTRNITSPNTATTTTAAPSVNRTMNATATSASSCQCNNGVRVNITSCRCECLSGWKSDPGNATHFVWCTRRADKDYTPINQGSSDMSSAGKLIVAVFSVSAALLTFCFCYFCRHNIMRGARFCATHLRRNSADSKAAAECGDPPSKRCSQSENGPAGGSTSAGNRHPKTMHAGHSKLVSTRTLPAEQLGMIRLYPPEEHGAIPPAAASAAAAAAAAAASAAAANSNDNNDDDNNNNNPSVTSPDSVEVTIPMSTFALSPDSTVIGRSTLSVPRHAHGPRGRAGEIQRAHAQRTKARSGAMIAETRLNASEYGTDTLSPMPTLAESPRTRTREPACHAADCDDAKCPKPRSREHPSYVTAAGTLEEPHSASACMFTVSAGQTPVSGSPAISTGTSTTNLDRANEVLSALRLPSPPPPSPLGTKATASTPKREISFSEEIEQLVLLSRTAPGSLPSKRVTANKSTSLRQDSSTTMTQQTGHPGLFSAGLGLDLSRVASGETCVCVCVCVRWCVCV